jgi:tripartite-type tricarboxylate transporter receptor subunit TctC
MTPCLKKLLAVATMAALPLVAGTAQAQENWPERPIQIVVPFNPGGDTDFNARLFAAHLEPELGVALPVINVDGAGGSIGARQVLTAEPDGHTVLFFHAAMLVNTASGIADFSFRDFEMAGIAGREPGGLIVVKADAEWQTMEELMQASAANPGSIDLTTNIGATTYLVGSLLNNAGGNFNFVDVGGSADRLTAVLGGNVDVSQNPVGQAKPYIESGDLRALAITAAERSPALPDVPTLIEQGYDVEFQYDYFFLFPKGTDATIVEEFTQAVAKVVESEEYAEEIRSTYFQEPRYLPPEEAIARLTEVEETVNSVEF